jgi:serine/arginine repetitive matrix protein 1
MSGSFYRGTTSEQDGRFANKEKKIIKSQQWPDEFNTRVDIKKVLSFSSSDV